MPTVDVEQLQPVSRTYQYRKVMKPMLERKRRARINRCLDELKDFILSSLQAEGENVNKLEKADILEFTVQHLRKLRRNGPPKPEVVAPMDGGEDRFHEGFTQCASEVSRCLASTPGVDMNLGTKLMTHLGVRLNEIRNSPPALSVRVNERCSPPPSSPSSISSFDSYTMPLTPSSMVSSCSRSSSCCSSESLRLLRPMDMSMTSPPMGRVSPVWRPW